MALPRRYRGVIREMEGQDRMPGRSVQPGGGSAEVTGGMAPLCEKCLSGRAAVTLNHDGVALRNGTVAASSSASAARRRRGTAEKEEEGGGGGGGRSRRKRARRDVGREEPRRSPLDARYRKTYIIISRVRARAHSSSCDLR